MHTSIFYNGIDVFSGVCPTPLASRETEMIRYGSRWGRLDNLTFNGLITGCMTYAQRIDKQKTIVSGFRYDFQLLEIKDDALSVITYPFPEVTEISFGESNQAFAVPFSIKLSCYPSSYFSGDYGILQPVNRFEFNESDEGITTLTHVISARGFDCKTGDSDAFQRAADWVNSRMGWSNQILPIFISGFNANMCPRQIKVSQDRLNARYEVNEIYNSDSYSTNFGLLRYTLDFASGIENGISQIGVNGTIEGCKNLNITGSRAIYSGFNAFNEANNQFKKITNRADLSPYPISKTVTEDVNGAKINFNYLFNDDQRPKINILYDISFSYDFESDSVQGSIDATITNRSPYSNSLWAQIQSIADNINLYSIIVPSYNSFVTECNPNLATFLLNPNTLSKSRTENQYELKIVLSESYDNKSIPPIGLQTYDYNLNFTPSISKFSLQPVLDGMGAYYAQNLGYTTRNKLQISVNGLGNDNTTQTQVKSILKSNLEFLMAQNLQGSYKLLESQNISISNESFNKKVQINAIWSAEDLPFSIP